MSLRYDDHLDMSGKAVEIIDAGTPTSYQVGYGVEENTVLDTAVVTLEGDTLVATGIGTATVKVDGELHDITVTAAPISMLLLIGQSNMRGSEGNANQSIVCPDGMVYSTYGDDRGESNTAMTVSNATRFAPSALTGTYSSINVVGTTDCLSGYPVNSLTEAGAGKIGPDSGFAYEWVKQTGEKVWVVNAAHGGTNISAWQPGTTEYEECQALFTACQETLRKEIAAGHFTLSHMGYFWCQGCSNRTNTAEWYVQKYLTMHESLKTELAFDHDSNSATENKTFEFGGIIPVRVGSTATCYRDGAYETTNPYAYHESYVDLRFSGPRVAQYWMCNNPELEDIWMVCNIGEDWVWMPDGTNGVSAYFQAHYPNGTVDYTTQVAQKATWYTPTTPAAVHDSIHYNQIGYNEVGREAARNALIMLGEMEAPKVETTVEFLSWDGYNTVDTITAAVTGASNTLVVPKVYPVWRSKEVTYNLSDGLTWNYYDLLAENTQISGTLIALDQCVTVVKTEPGSHYVDHLSELPEDVCCGVNLWNILTHDKEFFTYGTHWTIHSSGNVYSVTFPVNPGDLIYATAFGKAGENGSTSTNGIRVTFFNEYGVAKTTDPAGTYKEFVANGGYIIVPEGTTAANIPMWTNDSSNELYILSRQHDTTSETCSVCGQSSHSHTWSAWETVTAPSVDGPGKEQRKCNCGEKETREVEGVWQTLKLSEHMAPMPENYCSGTNLWAMMAHDKYYFANGINWGIYSSGQVYSVTIPVNSGDQIFASSFGAAGSNGHASTSGIRTTFFDAEGVLISMKPAEVYAEFRQNGYLTAPEGAVAINIAMWTNDDSWEIYILNRDHCYENGTCAGCGATQPGPVITQQPESAQQENGKKFAITVKAEGEGLKYQWYVKEAGAKAFKVSSNKTASYAYTMQTYMHNRQVYCVITDANGNSVQTETATITRPPQALRIVEQPKDAQQEIGQKFSISPKVEGEGLTYQWYVKESGAKAFKVSSIKGSAYALTMQKYMIGRQVYCVITDKYGNSVTTDVATISLPPVELKILQQPTDVYAAKGVKFSISPKVQGEGLTYQWYYKEGYMKDFKPSSNKTSAYAYSMQTYMNERSVYCVITDKYGNHVQTEVVTIRLEK